MFTKESITGASLYVSGEFPDYKLNSKQFKSLKLEIKNCSNINNVMNVLLKLKHTLKSLKLELLTGFSFFYEFFIGNTFLKHLSIQVKKTGSFVTRQLMSMYLMDLLSFEYINEMSTDFDIEIVNFIKSQINLSSLTYKIAELPIDLDKFLEFYEQMCGIMKLNANIKTLVLTFPQKGTVDFVERFVVLTKGIRRINFTVNSIKADIIVNLIQTKYHLI